MPTLIEIVEACATYDQALTIYAIKPWSCDSEAVLALQPDEGGLPSEASVCGAAYFIEISIAHEFLDDWIAATSGLHSIRELCERLIHYAIYDA